MPKKPAKKPPTKNEQAIKQVAERMGELYTQNWMATSQSYRPKLFSVDYSTLEKMAEANPLINAIINKRCEQIRQFCKVAREKNDRGFVIKPRDAKSGKVDEARVEELQRFFMDTGFFEDDEREDDFADLVEYIVRDSLVFDQNAIEIRRTRKGEVADLWYLDATTIERIAPNTDYYKQGMRYAQKDDRGKYCAWYKFHDLIFDYQNKRARLKYRGYGYSKLEQMIDLITTFLFSIGYNRDMFQKDKIPRGFLKITGEVDQKTLNAVRNHWLAEMNGYGARFNLPIIPSGKDGVGIDWQSLGQTNRDMEYHKLVMFIVSLTCAVFGIDPAELGLKPEDTQTLIGDSGDKRIQHSKDSGLGSLLSYIETICNKILKEVDPDYVFEFTGVKDEDIGKREDILKKQLETRLTIDEVREMEGRKPFNQPWSQVPLNTTILQIAGSPQPAGGQPGAPGEEGAPAEGEPSMEEFEQALQGKQGGENDEGEPVAMASEDDLEPVEKSAVRRSRPRWLDIDIR